MCVFRKGESVIDKLCLYKCQTKPFENIYTDSGLCAFFLTGHVVQKAFGLNFGQSQYICVAIPHFIQ